MLGHCHSIYCIYTLNQQPLYDAVPLKKWYSPLLTITHLGSGTTRRHTKASIKPKVRATLLSGYLEPFIPVYQVKKQINITAGKTDPDYHKEIVLLLHSREEYFWNSGVWLAVLVLLNPNCAIVCHGDWQGHSNHRLQPLRVKVCV